MNLTSQDALADLRHTQVLSREGVTEIHLLSFDASTHPRNPFLAIRIFLAADAVGNVLGCRLPPGTLGACPSRSWEAGGTTCFEGRVKSRNAERTPRHEMSGRNEGHTGIDLHRPTSAERRRGCVCLQFIRRRHRPVP